MSYFDNEYRFVSEFHISRAEILVKKQYKSAVLSGDNSYAERMFRFQEQFTMQRDSFDAGFNEIIEREVVVQDAEWEELGSKNKIVLTVKELLQYDPLSFVVMTLYLPSQNNGKMVDIEKTINMYADECEIKSKEAIIPSGTIFKWRKEFTPPDVGVRWEVISMGTHRKKVPTTIRETMYPHLGVFTASMYIRSDGIRNLSSLESPVLGTLPGILVGQEKRILTVCMQLPVMRVIDEESTDRTQSNPLLRQYLQYKL